MKRAIIFVLLSCLSFTACGKKVSSEDSLLEDNLPTEIESETNSNFSMRLKEEKLILECGEYLSADIKDYIDADDYSNISMSIQGQGLVTDDLLQSVPTSWDHYLIFENSLSGESLQLPYIVQDTTAPNILSYLGSYQFYLQNSDGTPKDKITLDSALIWTSDFNVAYNDASACTLVFSDTNQTFKDSLHINYISDNYVPGTYHNNIIITDLGGNETTIPVAVEVIDAPEPGENYSACICSDQCDTDSPYTGCSVCADDPTLCIGVIPELYEE